MIMALTRSFKETVQARVASDRTFREALLREGVETMLAGDVDTGKAILRDYIKATVGFEKLGAATGTSPKSLMRMFSAQGNPQARNLFSVIGQLQRYAGVRLHVTEFAGLAGKRTVKRVLRDPAAPTRLALSAKEKPMLRRA
jgi:DNA-binding phage protein